MSIRFKKIKLAKDNKVEIIYEAQTEDGWDEYTLKASEEPTETFLKAMEALAEDVAEMCEFPPDHVNRITVRGISMSYAGEKVVMGATISASKKLLKSNTPMSVNTPYKIEEHYSENGDDAALLEEECVERIQMLQAEAEKYLKGLRAQTNLFAKGE
jgi:hypothetical protein